ncbi:MAG: EAL domain-containing protein [Gallionella sp.]|jgi:PAS domain S-box-containing protein
MRGGVFRGVRAYVVSIAVIFTAAALVTTIYFTRDNLPWIAFLMGVFTAAVLAEAARASRSEWALMRRTAQLSSMKEKFENELRSRKSCEKNIADIRARSQLVDETLSVMVVLIDVDGHCRYHNRAFRDWLNLKFELIDGRHMRELLGARAYAGIATAVRQSLDGHHLHYEHLQEISGNAVYRLQVEHIPQFDAAGRVTGFFFLAEDITKRADLSVAGKSGVGTTLMSAVKADSGGNEIDGRIPETCFGQGRPDEGRLFIEAIQKGEFRLYCQLISPLPIDSGKSAHYAILIRLMGEEGSMVPPGIFFNMAETTGLMPYLDRWVVQQVLEWASKQQSFGHDNDSIFFINVAAATIGDPEFPNFLQNILNDQRMPGAILCFEVSDADLAARSNTVAEFIRLVRQCGCCVALSGFGRDDASFDRIRGFQVEFLKIDGGIILNMLSDPAELAKVVSINRIAKKIGVKTIAELVESDEIVAKLCEVGIDFSQGAGISQPRRLVE